MLILTRKLGETIRIGDDITITVMKIARGQIRLGIDAQREVKIVREQPQPRRVREPGRELRCCAT